MDGVEFGISFASAHRSAAGAALLRRLLYSCCCSRRSRMPHAPPPGARSCGASSCASSCLGRGSWLCAIPSIWLWGGTWCWVWGVGYGTWLVALRHPVHLHASLHGVPGWPARRARLTCSQDGQQGGRASPAPSIYQLPLEFGLPCQAAVVALRRSGAGPSIYQLYPSAQQSPSLFQ